MDLLHLPLSLTSRRERVLKEEEDDDGDEEEGVRGWIYKESKGKKGSKLMEFVR